MKRVRKWWRSLPNDRAIAIIGCSSMAISVVALVISGLVLARR